MGTFPSNMVFDVLATLAGLSVLGVLVALVGWSQKWGNR